MYNIIIKYISIYNIILFEKNIDDSEIIFKIKIDTILFAILFIPYFLINHFFVSVKLMESFKV